MTTDNDAAKALDILANRRGLEQWQKEELIQTIRETLTKSAKVDELLDALRFYADPASYQFIHGTASYMPIEVDDGYKAKTAIQRFNGEG